MTFDTGDDGSQAHIHARVAAYYTDKLLQHGPTPRGVDWRDRESQEVRFAGLARIFDGSAGSVIEIGCGYGALYGYLRRSGFDLDYTGYDISDEMIAAAKQACAGDVSAKFEVGSIPRQHADYCVASGIFNVRFDIPDERWRSYIFDTLDSMAKFADRGFAFNCLSSHCDRDRREPRLYYADPGEILNCCVARYGRRVSLLHGNPPYEFTVLAQHDRPK
jgi:SAM-dependent methyltransferase